MAIENPVINSAFEEPKRHFRFSDEGITEEIVGERRVSAYFVPIAQPKKRGRQLSLETEWTQERSRPNEFINKVRARVGIWRAGGHAGITRTTRELLEYWTRADRERRLFFCQVEALETVIYITEVAARYGDAWIENTLRDVNEGANQDLYRMAFKMATGAGKTVVMAMLIAWHTLNKIRNPQDARFSDAFLVVTPGITIKDRLRVLLPNDPQNDYRERDILPADRMAELGRAKIVITNFHAFLLHEREKVGRLNKVILAHGREENPFAESPAQMVSRVCRETGSKRGIIVLNDEAHHCYRSKPEPEEPTRLTGDERREVKKREEEARVWLSGLEAVKKKIGVKVCYDLSATPFFLKGSGYEEGTLFPWVVSDFSLIDAIESGIVKVPRVPVADNSMVGDQPTYRNIWLRIRDDLPKKGRGAEKPTGEPKLPAVLEAALRSLYSDYEKQYREWEQNKVAQAAGLTPPVFIVVCNNTSVSKIVFDFIAGWEKKLPDETTIPVPGALPIFSNVVGSEWISRPNTILVDSEQLEAAGAMSDEFKKIAAGEIAQFKAEYRERFLGRDAEELTDEVLLREVMNTVGKRGRLGEHVRCVVSVSMLTEGWDANTVTHILGVRAFGTQLLCEQVVGRGLRRMSYATERRTLQVNGTSIEFEAFAPEYAEVYGVPFSFIPTAGEPSRLTVAVTATRVRALEERIACEITFPRLIGYRYEIPSERLAARFTDDSRRALTTADLPTTTEIAPIAGLTEIHTLDDLKKRREQEVAFLLAKLVLERYLLDANGRPKTSLFPQVVAIAGRWVSECVFLKDNTFRQLLLLRQLADDAAGRIYRAIVLSTDGEKTLRPMLRPYDPIGSTRHVEFDTTRPVYVTSPDKCHLNYVVCDTEVWEQKLAQTLEEMPEVEAYVKNAGLGFTIPYDRNGEEANYVPDYIIRLRDPATGERLNLILEVSGKPQPDKVTKVATARTLWVPAVNAHGEFGRWAFLEVPDPYDCQGSIRAVLRENLGRGTFGGAMNPAPKIALPMDRICEFCEKWKIVELSLFGSALREDFGPESDVDFLARYAPDAGWSLFDAVEMEEELSGIVGRKVDLVSRRAIERSHNWIRRKAILESAKVLYAA